MNKISLKVSNVTTFAIMLFPIIFKGGMIKQGDSYWQIRAGLEWFNSHKIIALDTSSYIANGYWIPNSWGWNILLASIYKLIPEYCLFITTITFCSSISFIVFKKIKSSSVSSLNTNL